MEKWTTTGLVSSWTGSPANDYDRGNINNCSKHLAAPNLNTPRIIVSRILLNTLHFSIFFEHYPTQLLRFLFDYGWYNWVAWKPICVITLLQILLVINRQWNSHLAARAWGIKQKKSSWGSAMDNTFLLFYSTKPPSQVGPNFIPLLRVVITPSVTSELTGR